MGHIYLVLVCFVLSSLTVGAETSPEQPTPVYKIEGKVSVVDSRFRGTDWMSDTQILVDGGEYKGFLKADGSFTVSLVPPGSYLVEVASPNYLFEPYRVDITKGGKIRARRANFLQPSQVQVVAYPLRFVANKQAPFFEVREQWKVTDLLMNPMVLMMILPVFFVFVMPKLLNLADPEAQKEMQSQMNSFNNRQQMPDISEFMSNWFGGGAADAKRKKTTKIVGPKKAGSRR